MTAQGDVHLDEIERLREVLQHVADAPARVQAWLRAHGVAFDDLDERWQRVGFSLYNEIVEMSAKAKDVLDEGEAEGTKPVGQRMDEADAKLATRPVEQVVGELQAENRRLREVAERVVRANKDVERHGYASLRHMVYVLENVLREVQG